MIQEVKQIIESRQIGLISESEAKRNLDAYSVRGTFRADRSFIGYDYDRQERIEHYK